MCLFNGGGDKRTRTVHLLNAIQALYQMSYIPVIYYSFLLCRIANAVKLARSFPPRNRFYRRLQTLFAFDRADGATVFAGTAVDADVRIDLILGIALRNRVHGAGIRTSAARNAIFRNFMCHLPNLQLNSNGCSVFYIIT